jgi:hypothetical protein
MRRIFLEAASLQLSITFAQQKRSPVNFYFLANGPWPLSKLSTTFRCQPGKAEMAVAITVEVAAGVKG